MQFIYTRRFDIKIKFSYATLLAFTLISGCYNNKEELLYPGSNTPPRCATTPAKFSTDVLPLIQSKCAIPGCHNAAASGGLTFQTYTQISAAKLRIHTQAVVQKTMPPTGPLLPAESDKLKCWIDGGGLND